MIDGTKGSAILFGLMLGLTIILLGLALAPSLSETINNARNATSGDTTGLDCDNESISNFNKATCVATDLSLFYIIGFILFLGGSVIAAKIYF